MKKNLVLIGMMAVGKSTLGKIVARKYKLEFIDTDVNIEKKNSMPISKIFETKGEVFFRMEEEKEVLKCLKKKNCIIALGGGAFVNKNIRENILKNSISIWLNVDMKTLKKRFRWNNRRPLLNKINNQAEINKLYNKREKFYKKANYRIDCDNINKNRITSKIIELYEKHQNYS